MALDSALAHLPPPQIIEELDHETLHARQVRKFIELWDAARVANPALALPEYDVQMLETDPLVIIGQSETYRELLLRQRVNEAAQSNLLAYAAAGNLENLAAFYGVYRMSGEEDGRLKRRVILEIQGRSTGGTIERYSAIAMAADTRVRDVVVYTSGRSPVINVAVFSTSLSGAADETLLQSVRAALESPSKRMVNDTINVKSAVRIVVDLTADVWLLPDTPMTILENMQLALRDSWARAQGLGRDLLNQWWVSQLMLDGVHHVVPTGTFDFAADPHEAISIGQVTLSFRGREY